MSDARWSASFTDSSWAALLVWILLLVVLQAAAWPLARTLFWRFPDRGWAFSRLLALVVAGYAHWLPASLDVVPFRAVLAWAALAATAGLGAVVSRWWRAGPPGADRYPWRIPEVAAAEAVFWGAFALFLAFRLANPDSYHPIWSGEKPMEFAHLNAVLRADHFPPADPWYAGATLNYYYYGAYLVAFLVKLTGVPVQIAFNLALPTFGALLAAGVFSVGAALGRQVSPATRASVGGGLVAVLLVCLCGNLVVAARLVDGLLGGFPSANVWIHWFWEPSRAIPRPETQEAITEFPYFSLLFADLHAHVVALPITVLASALALALALEWRAVATGNAMRVLPREAVRLALLGLVLGTLWMANTWDAPTYGALAAVGIVMAVRAVRPLPRAAALVAGALALVGAVTFLTTLPFRRHYTTFYGEVGWQDADTPLVAVESHMGVFLLVALAGLAFLATRAWRPPALVRVPAVPLSALLAALLLRWAAQDRSPDIAWLADAAAVLVVVGTIAAGLALPRPDPACSGPPWWARATAAAGFGGALILVALDRPVPALYLGIGAVAAASWVALPGTGERFALALVAGAALIGAGLEGFYLVDDLDGGAHYRMNSVFKFYNQVWVLLALASAFLLTAMAASLAAAARTRASDSVPEHTDSPGRRSSHDWWAGAGLVVAAVAVAAALAFPLKATGIRLAERFPQAGGGWTLDAYAWMGYGEVRYADGTWVGYADDLAAIDWFNEHVDGTPTIAEASFGIYRCNGSRFSVATGLPAVVGWDWHEYQQRHAPDLSQRERDLRRLYADPDPAAKRAILERYGIRYVVLGETERRYPVDNGCGPTDEAVGIAALEAMVGTTFDVAFSSGSTTVLRVRE